MLAEVLWWSALVLLGYAYAGYPLILRLLGTFRGTTTSDLPACTPAVSLVIAAYNEEAVIAEKLENSLRLDYPPDKLEILVVSDASTDATNAIVARYSDRGVRLLAREARAGKAEALNAACPLARGDILVLSDANGMYEPTAIRKLVRHFARPEVGCVSGALRYNGAPGGAAHQGESLFLRYDAWQKQLESRLGIVIGAFGGIFAFRRSLFAPLDPMLPNDLETPLRILQQGYAVLYDPEAVCTEPASPRVGVEFGRHARISAQVYHGAAYWLRALATSFRPLVFFAFISKKVLRWLSPFFLACLLVTPFFLDSPFYRSMQLVNVTGLGMASLGAVLYWTGRSYRVFAVPFYALVGNAAVIWGMVRFLTGAQGPTWSVVREKPLPPTAVESVPDGRK